MVLKGRITTSFGRIARTRSLVSTQSLSAAPRAKNWSRYRIFSIFFFWRILQKNPWCHRPGSVVKDTSDTVPRPRHRFFHSIYGSKSPNPEDNRARRKFWRISNCCSHVPRHVTQTDLRGVRIEEYVKSNNSWPVHILTVLTQFLARTRVYWSEGVQRMRQIDSFIILRFGSEIFWRIPLNRF